MARRAGHPDNELFDYLNGRSSAEAGQEIERHLASCAGCQGVAAVVRTLKESPGLPDAAPDNVSAGDGHPDVAALAALFYEPSARKKDRQVAAHVARCRECLAEVASYAQAEKAAAAYASAAGSVQEEEQQPSAVPQAAWSMIREWEECEFAQPRPAGAAIDYELLASLSEKLREQRELAPGTEGEVRIAVIDSGGDLRGVEIFKRVSESGDAEVLRHADASAAYDSKPVHVLLDFGDEKRVVLSEPIERDTVRIAQPVRRTRPLRSDYFIVEDREK